MRSLAILPNVLQLGKIIREQKKHYVGQIFQTRAPVDDLLPSCTQQDTDQNKSVSKSKFQNNP